MGLPDGAEPDARFLHGRSALERSLGRRQPGSDSQTARTHAKDALRALRTNSIARNSRRPISSTTTCSRRTWKQDIAGLRFRMYLLPINQRGGIQTADELAERLRFETVKDYEDWIARLRAFRPRMDQQIALMREGREGARSCGRRACMDRVPQQIDKQIVANPEAEPVLQAVQEIPEGDCGSRAASACEGREAKRSTPA